MALVCKTVKRKDPHQKLIEYIRMIEALNSYNKENRLRHLSPETIEKDTVVLTNLITWLSARDIVELGEISKDHLRNYFTELKTNGVKSISINGYKSNINRFLEWCKTRGYLKVNPGKSIRDLKEDKPLPSYVPSTEMERIFDSFEKTTTLSVTQIVLFEFFYGTGIRTSELINLDIVDVDLKNCIVNVRRGKGGLQRYVPFPESLVPVIRRYLQIRDQRHFTSPILFPNAHGARLHRSAAYQYIKAILDTTTSSKKGAHTIRHSYASHLLGRGANLKAIAELLGHRSYKTTVKYTHLDIDSKRAIYDKAHPKA